MRDGGEGENKIESVYSLLCTKNTNRTERNRNDRKESGKRGRSGLAEDLLDRTLGVRFDSVKRP